MVNVSLLSPYEQIAFDATQFEHAAMAWIPELTNNYYPQRTLNEGLQMDIKVLLNSDVSGILKVDLQRLLALAELPYCTASRVSHLCINLTPLNGETRYMDTFWNMRWQLGQFLVEGEKREREVALSAFRIREFLWIAVHRNDFRADLKSTAELI